jgi:NAD(P)-dependent dehydrogenase (short-subunit alcohol dehydrogenase family)
VYKCDITNVETVRRTFASITESVGPVDILVNNAGIAVGGLAFDETFEGFWKAVEVNFKGTMLCVYEVLRGMKERRSGCIVNMASRAATVDMAGGLSYNSSKAAVARATHSLQEEFEQAGLGEQLHTYCLHPGGVWGKMVTGELSYLSFFFCLDTGNNLLTLSVCVFPRQRTQRPKSRLRSGISSRTPPSCAPTRSLILLLGGRRRCEDAISTVDRISSAFAVLAGRRWTSMICTSWG